MQKRYKDIPLIIDRGNLFMYTSSMIDSEGKVEPILHCMDIGFAINESMTKAYVYAFGKSDLEKLKYDHARLFFTRLKSLKFLMIRNDKSGNTYVFRITDEAASMEDADKNGVLIRGSFFADIHGTVIKKNHYRPLGVGGMAFFVTDDDTFLLMHFPDGAAAKDINENLNHDNVNASEYITLEGTNDVEHYICLTSKNSDWNEGFLIPLEDILTTGRRIDYHKIKVAWEKYKLRKVTLKF